MKSTAMDSGSFFGKMSKKSGGERRKESERRGRSDASSGRTDRGRKKRWKRLEDQMWYHGCIPREDANAILVRNGQFLVRTSGGEKLNLVISTRHKNKVLHFIMEKEGEGWKLEGEAFPSVYHLIYHHHKTKTPLTKESGAIIRTGLKKQKWQLDDRDIEMDKEIGAGQFGKVFTGHWKTPEGNKRVAIKQCVGSLRATQAEKAKLLREAKLTLQYRHPNVVCVYGVAADRPPIKVVMEFCAGGDLESHLRRVKTSTLDKKRYSLEAAKGMEYLARKRCIHRDLAARNCLLGPGGQVKISDFGMSKIQGEYKLVNRKQGIPIRWTAPEGIREGVFTTKSDVYSYGVLLWEIMTDGATPWKETGDTLELCRRVLAGERLQPPQTTPPLFLHLMEKTWRARPTDRPSFTDIISAILSPPPSHSSSTHFSHK